MNPSEITSLVLSDITPNSEHLDNKDVRKYMLETYGEKGECLVVPSPYNSDNEWLCRRHNVINIVKKNTVSREGSKTFTEDLFECLNNDLVAIPFLEDTTLGPIQVKPRHIVEHNPKYWQIVVCGLIKTDDGLVILKNKSTHPRLPNRYTMIQGQVDYSPSVHLKSSNDFLRGEFVREIEEELKIDLGDHESCVLDSLTKIEGAIQINTDFTSMEHFGIVCVCDLRGICKTTDIQTNEPDKHDVIAFKSLFELEMTEMDSWVIHVAMMLNDDKG